MMYSRSIVPEAKVAKSKTRLERACSEASSGKIGPALKCVLRDPKKYKYHSQLKNSVVCTRILQKGVLQCPDLIREIASFLTPKNYCNLASTDLTTWNVLFASRFRPIQMWTRSEFHEHYVLPVLHRLTSILADYGKLDMTRVPDIDKFRKIPDHLELTTKFWRKSLWRRTNLLIN